MKSLLLSFVLLMSFSSFASARPSEAPDCRVVNTQTAPAFLTPKTDTSMIGSKAEYAAQVNTVLSHLHKMFEILQYAEASSDETSPYVRAECAAESDLTTIQHLAAWALSDNGVAATYK